MLGTLDKKRGIVNILIHRSGRKTYLSMDHGLVALAMELFDGDPKRLSAWIQQRVNALDALVPPSPISAVRDTSAVPDGGDEWDAQNGSRVNGHDEGQEEGGAHQQTKAPASGFSRLVQREIIFLALSRIRAQNSAGAASLACAPQNDVPDEAVTFMIDFAPAAPTGAASAH